MKALKIRASILVSVCVILAAVAAVACGSAEQATTAPTATPAPTAAATAASTAGATDAAAAPTSAPVVAPTAPPIAVGTVVVPTRGVVRSTAQKPWDSYLSQAKYGGLLRNAEPVLPDHWDLHQSCCNPGPGAARDLYNNLVMYDPTDQKTIVGDLANSWEWAADGRSVTFTIWDNAVWSDGQPVTADDVVFSLNRMVAEGVSRPRVKNLRPYYAGSQAIDPTTIKVNTLFPNPAAFLPFLAIDFMSIVPKHVLEGREDAEEIFDNPENIVASGAYLFVSHDVGQGWEFEKNPNYFKEGLPFVDGKQTIVIKDKDRFITAFMTDQMDISHRGAGGAIPLIDMVSFKNDWEADGRGVVYPPGATIQGLFNMNWTAPPFEDPRVRRAVFLALDRKELAEVHQLGFAKLGQPFFPGSDWASSDEEVATWPGFRYLDESGELYLGDPIGVDGLTKHPDDIAEAQRLMAEAGYPDGFKAAYHTYSVNKNIPVIMKQRMQETLNIEIDINITDVASVIAAEQAVDFSHFLSVHNGPNIVDPDDLLLGVYLTGAPRNPIDYEDPELRAIFEQQKGESDQEKRKALIREAEAIILKGEHHMIQYYWYGDPIWIVPNRVKNYVPRQTVQYGMGTEHIWLDP